MPSVFSKIITGELPSYKIAEDENYLAFLDIFPLRRGHVIVIPRKEVDQLFDLDNTTYQGLMSFSQRMAHAIKAAIPCNRVSMHVIGLEVPHAHVHLIPINTMNDCDFKQEKLKLSKDQFQEIAASIAEQFK